MTKIMERMFHFMLIFIALITGEVQSECPDGWVEYGGSCYFFSHEDVSFTEAKHICKFHGAHLVHIDTAIENSFLKSFIGNLLSAHHWIGLNDNDIEGVWTWSDTDTPTTLSLWDAGEPNGGMGENCGVISDSRSGWDDQGCTQQWQPICEKNISQSTCKDGQVSFEGSCYLFSHENLHFAEAENYCRQHGSHLVHVETPIENTFLKSFLKGMKSANHWMGLTDEVIEDIWKWYDTDTIVEYTDWYPGNPNNGRAGDCACFYASVGFQWADESCTQPFQPICETKNEDTSVIIG